MFFRREFTVHLTVLLINIVQELLRWISLRSQALWWRCLCNFYSILYIYVLLDLRIDSLAHSLVLFRIILIHLFILLLVGLLRVGLPQRARIDALLEERWASGSTIPGIFTRCFHI